MTLAVPGATGFVALAQRAVIVVSGSCHRPGNPRNVLWERSRSVGILGSRVSS